jgi:hypothetical protein
VNPSTLHLNSITYNALASQVCYSAVNRLHFNNLQALLLNLTTLKSGA